MVKKDNQFMVRVESDVVRVNSYLVTANSKAEAKAIVKSGLIEPDNTDFDLYLYKSDRYKIYKLEEK